MKPKTAILIGATGLVGAQVLKELEKQPEIEKIKVFTRRSAESKSEKVEEFIIDFDQIDDYQDQIVGDVLFSCLGTTLKKAGNKEAQFKIDVTYQDNFARIASKNKVPGYFLISAPNANTKSRFFYSRIKGELEERVQEYKFNIVRIFRPSILTGPREEERKGEKWGAWFMNTIGEFIPFISKYKPIPGAVVARAMVNEYIHHSSIQYKSYDLKEIFEINDL